MKIRSSTVITILVLTDYKDKLETINYNDFIKFPWFRPFLNLLQLCSASSVSSMCVSTDPQRLATED